MQYKLVVTQTKEGFTASCPTVPGCHAEAKTEAEAVEHVTREIEEYLAAVKDVILVHERDSSSKS